MGCIVAETDTVSAIKVDDETVFQTECFEPFALGRLSITVLGASGDLAKKKTYPALLDLFCNNLLPQHVCIVGFSLAAQSAEAFRDYIRPWLLKHKDGTAVDRFLARCWYFGGDASSATNFAGLNEHLLELEHATTPSNPAITNRLFYFAIPPDAFLASARSIKQAAMSKTGFNRLIVEKPFGHDLASAQKLAADLQKNFDEDFIYRIDHYLGKEMIQNLMTFRFANSFMEPLFNKDHVACVNITFKEDFGTEGRGGYFTNYGIIRDIIQNHLMQVLSVLAMEKPRSADGNAKRDAKIAVIKAIKSINPEDVVIGQYVTADGKPGYLDDDSIKDKAKAELVPTFAAMVLYINNSRWQGVPFLIKAGKALEERKAEIRIQFKDAVGVQPLFGGEQVARNELVMRLQPTEAIYMKTTVKSPGLESKAQQVALGLSYENRFKGTYNPDAYTRLVLEALRGNNGEFVRGDEIAASWALFDPLLDHLECKRSKKCCSFRCWSWPAPTEPRMPLPYEYGSRGPAEADQLFERHGFVAPFSDCGGSASEGDIL